MIMAAIMLVPFAISFIYSFPDSFGAIFADSEKLGFIIAILFSAAAGYILSSVFRTDRQLEGIREGFVIVSVGWVTLALLGAIPFLVYFLRGGDNSGFMGFLTAFTNAYFEISSGFTTTGATILTDIEAVPKGLIFWRSLTHWLGGMGIITLAIAIFPAMGVSGYHMFRGEVPGPTTERIQPRLAQTAAILWGVYVLLSGAETLLLMLGGMNWFDSLCHTFGTMATGGFGTKNTSIGYYNSDYFDWVITVFMFLAGVNFLLHYRALRGDFKDMFGNPEFKFYFRTVAATIIIMTAVLYFSGLKPVNESFAHHRNLIRFGLLILMYWGGCAGSTGGGMKMMRIMVVLKVCWRELQKVVKPHLVAPVKIGKTSLDEERVMNIAAFFMLFMVITVIAGLLMMLFIPNLETAFSTVVATMGNIGPGLSGVGAYEHYAWIPIPGKWILIVCMLLGRLEVFTILVALRPSTWKK